MSIKIGDTTIEKLYLGSSEIEKIYQGDTAIYSGGSEPPSPTPQYRWVETSEYECGTYTGEIDGDAYIDVCAGYPIEKKQVSYDSGTTWADVSPSETRTGQTPVIEYTGCCTPDYSTVVDDNGDGSYFVTMYFQKDSANNKLTGLYTGTTTLPIITAESGLITFSDLEYETIWEDSLTWYDNNGMPYLETDDGSGFEMDINYKTQYDETTGPTTVYSYDIDIDNVGGDLNGILENLPNGEIYRLEISLVES